ncbi:hypothetical protein V6N13_011718 [Hibiscus sabdariffa]
MWRYMAKNGATEHSSKQTSLYETSLAVVTLSLCFFQKSRGSLVIVRLFMEYFPPYPTPPPLHHFHCLPPLPFSSIAIAIAIVICHLVFPFLLTLTLKKKKITCINLDLKSLNPRDNSLLHIQFPCRKLNFSRPVPDFHHTFPQLQSFKSKCINH